MAKKVKFTTPFGVAKYPHISSPDTKGKFADNKFKTKLVMKLDAPGAQAFIKHIDDAALEIHGSAGARLYKPYNIDEDAGEVEFIMKTAYAPAIFDAGNKPAKGVNIGGGSVIRLMGVLVEYEKGITAQINQVQIKELNGFGTSAFDEVEDGYTYDESDNAPGFGDDDTTTSGDEGTDGKSNSSLDI